MADSAENSKLHQAVASGDLPEVAALVGTGADVNAKYRRMSPLHLAVKGGHAAIIAVLLRAGADINVRTDGEDYDSFSETDDWMYDGQTPLHMAVAHKNIALLTTLISAGADVDARTDGGITPLHWATRCGLTDIVATLIREGADVNAQLQYGGTPLHEAVDGYPYTSIADIVSLLIEAGAGVNGYSCYTPLHKAVEENREEAVAALIRAGANVNMRGGKHGATPLHLAYNENETIITALIGAGADINAKDDNGDTPLHWALDNSSHVAALIKAKADVNAQNKERLTPLNLAIAMGSKDTVAHTAAMFKKMGMDDEDINDAIAKSHAKYEEVVAMLKAAGAHNEDIDCQDIRLHWEALFRDDHCVNEEIKAGADVNARGKHLATPLHRAASRGREEDYGGIISDLIEAGADVNAKDDQQRTPLDLAIIGCHIEAAKSLREAGAVVNTQDDRQKTPLHDAVRSREKPDEIAALIESGADVNARDDQNDTPLHKAKSPEVVSLLVKAGADVNASGEYERTSLHWAAYPSNNLGGVFGALIRAGADVNAKDKFQRTPLHLAVSVVSIDRCMVGQDFAITLIKAGANVNAPDDFQETPLHLAANKGSTAVVSALMEAGADANIKNANQQTPLHLAADRGCLDIVVALIDGGADVNAQSILRITPLFLAMRRKHKDVAAALVRAGAEIIEPQKIANAPQQLTDNNKPQQPAHTPAMVRGNSLRVIVGSSGGGGVRLADDTTDIRHCALTVGEGQLFVEDENNSGGTKIKDGGEWRTVSGAVAITPDTMLMFGDYQVLARDLLAQHSGALLLFGETAPTVQPREPNKGGIRRNPETGEIEGL